MLLEKLVLFQDGLRKDTTIVHGDILADSQVHNDDFEEPSDCILILGMLFV
jgi:hypothetical protein